MSSCECAASSKRPHWRLHLWGCIRSLCVAVRMPQAPKSGPFCASPSPSNKDDLPTEFIVDTYHDDVELSLHVDRVGDADWARRRPTTQAEIVVLDFRRPVGGEGVFDARSQQPAAVGVGRAH